VLSSLATGLLIASVCRSQFQAVQCAVFYVLPVFMLSGAYAPIALIPRAVRLLSYLFSLLYFCQAVQAVTLRGAGLAMVWQDMVILRGFVVVLLWATLGVKKRVA